MKRRFQRGAKLRQRLAGDDGGLVLPEVAELEPLELSLERLRELERRVEQQHLKPGDWAAIRSVLVKYL